jgi:hypothetical protein
MANIDHKMTNVEIKNDDIKYYKSAELKNTFINEIQKLYEQDKNLDTINKQKKDFDSKYFKKTNLYELNTDFSMENDKVIVNFKKTDNIIEINKQKLKNRIKEQQKERSRKQNPNFRKIDHRVTKKMMDLYEASCKYMRDVPTPSDILNNMTGYVQDTKRHLMEIFLSNMNNPKTTDNEENLKQQSKERASYVQKTLNMPYTKYLQFMTGVNEKDVMNELMQYYTQQMKNKEDEKKCVDEHCTEEHNEKCVDEKCTEEHDKKCVDEKCTEHNEKHNEKCVDEKCTEHNEKHNEKCVDEHCIEEHNTN